MDINIYQFIEGAKKAEGLTVIIDVFRAYTTACYLFANNAGSIYVTSEVEKARSLAKNIEESILIGERNGIKLEGFDYGNSPYIISKNNFNNKNIVFTTSAGTKGIINAKKAEKIITGSFVNASAVASYIKNKKPEKVSLVAMGINGIKKADEDILLAEHLKKLLQNKKTLSQDEIRTKLRYPAGTKFFNDETQKDMPKEDFEYSLKIDRFNFILKANKISDNVFQLNLIK
ncbi:MAG: 2-phosphosulfolactate phosphatase [bacterium]